MTANIEKRKMATEERCVYGDIEYFGMVYRFSGMLTVDRSTRQGDLISVQSSVLDSHDK